MKTYCMYIPEKLSDVAIKHFYGQDKNITIQKHYIDNLYILEEEFKVIHKINLHPRLRNEKCPVSGMIFADNLSIQLQKEFKKEIEEIEKVYSILEILIKTPDKKLALLNINSDNDDIKFISYNIITNNFRLDNQLPDNVKKYEPTY